MLIAADNEQARRREVLSRILDDVRENRTIKLPDFDPDLSQSGGLTAFQSVGIEPNPYGGTVGDFRYQFEGEEDLLHLIITQVRGEALTPEEGQEVVSYLLRGVPPALIWIKPGQFTQHFYFGHDELLTHLQL
ncbi:MAG: hypothetical protein JST35_05445 [Armatimonadetes bacterium]|nr:hypothetical protein [Armatimonadota bacterium]